MTSYINFMGMMFLVAIHILFFTCGIDSLEASKLLTCRCGATKKTFVPFPNGLVNANNTNTICDQYKNCDSCVNGSSYCVTCPKGRWGVYCTEGRATQTHHVPIPKLRRHKRAVRCVELKPPKNGFFNCWHSSRGSECTAQCYDGYIFQNYDGDEFVLRCSNGRWSPSSQFPDCRSSGSCDVTVKGGSYNCTANENGYFCDMSCYRRYAGRFQCNPGIGWSPQLPACVIPNNPPSSGGQRPAPCRCLNGGQCSPSTGRCECPSGYSGETCDIYTETIEVVSCTDPGHILNGRRRDIGFSNGGIAFVENSVVEYTCEAGYALTGERSLTCLGHGLWSADVPICSRSRKPSTTTTTTTTTTTEAPDDTMCSDPGFVANGNRWYSDGSASTSRRSSFPVGSTMVFSCNDGYSLHGATLIKCSPSGEWSRSLPQCRSSAPDPVPKDPDPVPGPVEHDDNIYCSDPGVDINGIREEANAIKTDDSDEDIFSEGTTLDYVCREGYSLQGESSITCLSNGEWSGSRPTCKLNRQLECGVKGVTVARIRNGQETEIGDWPWQVALMYQIRTTPEIICGGALISTNTILTAAHCLHRKQLHKFSFFFGKYHASNAQDDDQVIRRAAASSVVHPRYNYTTFDNDFAIIRFRPHIILSTRIHTICLPTQETTRNNLIAGSNGYVTGWGLTENKRGSETLMMAKIPFVSKKKCKDTYMSQNIDFALTDSMFCAGYESGGVDSCTGDSGGPMCFHNERSNRYVLEGLVSFGVTHDCGVPNRYTVYARVGYVTRWIRDNL